jgi:hypothetical protein
VDGAAFTLAAVTVSIVTNGLKSGCNSPYPQSAALDLENAVGGHISDSVFSTDCCGFSAGNVRRLIMENTTWAFTGQWNTAGFSVNTPGAGFMGYTHADPQRSMEVSPGR